MGKMSRRSFITALGRLAAVVSLSAVSSERAPDVKAIAPEPLNIDSVATITVARDDPLMPPSYVRKDAVWAPMSGCDGGGFVIDAELPEGNYLALYRSIMGVGKPGDQEDLYVEEVYLDGSLSVTPYRSKKKRGKRS